MIAPVRTRRSTRRQVSRSVPYLRLARALLGTSALAHHGLHRLDYRKLSEGPAEGPSRAVELAARISAVAGGADAVASVPSNHLPRSPPV